jgi:hypothetical protein
MQLPCARPWVIAGRKWIPPYRREIAASLAAAANDVKLREAAVVVGVVIEGVVGPEQVGEHGEGRA